MDNIKRLKHHQKNHWMVWFQWSIILIRNNTCTDAQALNSEIQRNQSKDQVINTCIDAKALDSEIQRNQSKVQVISIFPQKITTCEKITSHFKSFSLSTIQHSEPDHKSPNPKQNN